METNKEHMEKRNDMKKIQGINTWKGITKMKNNTILTSSKLYERIFIFVSLFSFILWLLVLIYEGEMSNQFNLFFRQCEDFFADTLNVIGYSALRDVYNCPINGMQEKAYPPLSYFLLYFFSRIINCDIYYTEGSFINMYKEPTLLIILIICTMIVMIFLYELIRTLIKGNNMTKRLIALSCLISSPMLFTLERGNTILIVLLFFMFYLFFYNSENKFLKEISLISLAIVGALKITPAVIGILLIYNKQWKEVFRTLVYGIVFGILPFFFFKGGLSNIFLFVDNLKQNLTVYNSNEGCTLLAGLLSYGVEGNNQLVTIMKIITYIICFSLMIIIPLYKKNWEKVLAVSIVLVILPSHSGYYCILYLFPALIMFLNDKNHSKCDLIVLLAFVIMTISYQSYIGTHFINYHLTIYILTAFIFIRGIKQVIIWSKNRRLNKKLIYIK